MIHQIKKYKALFLTLKVFVIVSIIIPIVIVGYEILVLGKDNVVFFKETPLAISLTIVGYYLILLFLSVAWLIQQLRVLIQIKNESQKNELLLLKSQVNPHFFFNTLNNLYGLVTKDTNAAQQLILKLSDMMRYSIYEGQKEVVKLSDEIAFIEHYMKIHTMRYHKKIEVTFLKDMDRNDYTITPLLFINLVENAFKHGVENVCENAFVNINLSVNNRKLLFSIENNIDSDYEQKPKGIGLENLQRRLELIYPKQHQLSFEKNEYVYKAKLSINL